MHYCPYCGQPCYCDSDDSNYGDYPCEKHDDESDLCRFEIEEDEEDY